MTYHYEFDENGGYDCIYGAFRIVGPLGVVAEVDLRHHGQASCEPISDEVKARGEAVARAIVDGLNDAVHNDHEWPRLCTDVSCMDAIRWKGADGNYRWRLLKK